MVYHPSSSRADSPIGWTLAVCLFFAALFSRASAYCCPGVSYFFENLVIYNPAMSGSSFLQNVDNSSPMISYTIGIVNVVPNDSDNLFSSGILLDFDISCNTSTTYFTVLNALHPPIPTAIIATSVVALIRRGGTCTWSTKLANAISTGSSLNLQVVAAVIYDNETNVIGTAGINVTAYTDDDISDGVSSSAPGYAPTIFVPNVYGVKLQSLVGHLKSSVIMGVREFVMLQIANVQDQLTTQQEAVFSFPKGWALWVIIFGTVALTGFIWYRWRRIRAYLLAHPPVVGQPVLILLRQLRGTPPIPLEVLETFPVVRFEPGACKNTECAICLEELGGDDTRNKAREIRVLPCQHGFCKDCVGEWLLNNTALCPICKYNCFPSELRDTGNSESSENIAVAESGSPAVGRPGVPAHVVVDVADGNAAQNDEITLDTRVEDVSKLEVAERDGEDSEVSVEVARSEAGTQVQGASGEVEEPKARTAENVDSGAVSGVSEQSDAQS
ncbi:hypothetical protein BC937DRAFT_87630 [Endogone sp. FLAS-F59071]|nr:hypothetical protein BC937DRAFT_87630 [Endogone sp. FLAS-F59071]|eukprot:RUS19346.1 hypothetical protein BC937DRAFT_87630 [Endogone sp. FLAS-F59071]